MCNNPYFFIISGSCFSVFSVQCNLLTNLFDFHRGALDLHTLWHAPLSEPGRRIIDEAQVLVDDLGINQQTTALIAAAKRDMPEWPTILNTWLLWAGEHIMTGTCRVKQSHATCSGFLQSVDSAEHWRGKRSSRDERLQMINAAWTQ